MGLLAMKVTLADGRELVVEADARIDTVDEHGAPVIRLMKDGRVVETFRRDEVREPIQGLTHDA